MNRLHFRMSSTATDANATTSAVQASRIQDLTQSSQKVAKLSLSRGLAMNKFEKVSFSQNSIYDLQDFMIFPEYSDTDDVSNITGYVSSLRASLEASKHISLVKIIVFSLSV